MSIERINNLNNQYNVGKTATTKKNSYTASNDNIQISDVAKEKAKEIKLQADIKFFTKMTVSSPTDSSRAERLNEIKAKLADGVYDNPSKEVLEKVAGNLLDAFFTANIR
jgi:anti-sigma28 factor (negative regulator of flagellin synthesis)